MAFLVLLVGFGRVVYEKQRHFHGLAYRRLNGQQALLAQLELEHKSRDRRLSGTERSGDLLSGAESPNYLISGTERSGDLLSGAGNPNDLLSTTERPDDCRLSGTERLDDCRLCGTQRSDDLLLPSKLKLENLEQLFFIPQDFSTSIAAAPEENDPKEGLGREVMVDYFDLLPDLWIVFLKVFMFSDANRTDYVRVLVNF